MMDHDLVIKAGKISFLGRLDGRPALAQHISASGLTVCPGFVYTHSRSDRSTFSNPTLTPEGIAYVVANGEIVINRGVHTGTLPGRILALNPGDS